MIPFSAKTLAFLVLCAIALPGCVGRYSAPPITGTVYDADTGKPLEGVIVDAHWELMGGLEGGNVRGEAMIEETVTDATGTFRLPGWGPKWIFSSGDMRHHFPEIDGMPELILFKSGYEMGLMTPERWGGDTSHPVRTFPDGKEITLKLFEGTPKKYADTFWAFPDYAFASQCRWKKIPKMMQAMRDLSRDAEGKGISVGNFYWDLINNGGYGCASVDNFLKEHAQ